MGNPLHVGTLQLGAYSYASLPIPFMCLRCTAPFRLLPSGFRLWPEIFTTPFWITKEYNGSYQFGTLSGEVIDKWANGFRLKPYKGHMPANPFKQDPEIRHDEEPTPKDADPEIRSEEEPTPIPTKTTLENRQEEIPVPVRTNPDISGGTGK